MNEKRRDKRVIRLVPCELYLKDGSEIKAFVRDISERGIAFVLTDSSIVKDNDSFYFKISDKHVLQNVKSIYGTSKVVRHQDNLIGCVVPDEDIIFIQYVREILRKHEELMV